jgi:serine/threonine protein kinase
MNPDRWEQVKQILDSVMGMPAPERDIFIEKAAGGETSLFQEVKSLLAYKSTASNFLQSPVIGLEDRALVSHSLTGKKLGHYQILEKLGSGGMGEVYRAKDLALGRQAAIKVLPPGIPQDCISRLSSEAKASAKLQHPGIATFFESGQEGDIEYMAMEYVDGETLRSRISRGPLSVESVISIATELLEALAHAHAAGILHRDIKPENIMLMRGETPKLLDFGLAIPLLPSDTEETQSMIRIAVAGTLGYMSPEQARGEANLDERSDLFSLGAVLYEALSGQPAFAGETAADRLAAVLYKEPAPLASLGFFSPVSEIIRRALQKDKALRFASAAAFLREMQSLGDSPVRIGGPNILAVMEFKNLSNDSSDDWLGTGIAESLTTDLAQLPGLKIIPRERIVQARAPSEAEKQEPLSIAQAMGCRWMLDGSFQKMGSMVQIMARLVEVATLRIAATEKLDGSMTQIFAMQDRLSAAVANTLQIQVPASQAGPDRPVLTAYECYNRGRQFFLGFKKGGFERAASLYQEAIAIDPHYALAYAGLASISTMKWTYTTDPADFNAAKQNAYRATELDPSLGEPHVWLGYMLLRSGQLEEALAEEKTARKLEPSNAIAPYFEGLILRELGRMDEAISSLQDALQIDQYHLSGALGVLGGAYLILDKWTEATWCLQKVVQLENDNKIPRGSGGGACLGEVYRRMGDIGAAKAACLAALEMVESSDLMLRDYNRGFCLNTLGRCAFSEGNLAAASAAFNQTIAHIRGRKRTQGAGFLIAQALAGEAQAGGGAELLDEAVHIFRNRTGWNFSAASGNLEGDVAIDLGIAAAALGRTSEAQEWYEYAKRQVLSQFRLGELEKALSEKPRTGSRKPE